MTVDRRFVVTLSCPDRVGIVARIAGRLAGSRASTTSAASYIDADGRWFASRRTVTAEAVPDGVDAIRGGIAGIAEELGDTSGSPVR